jgi:hypothetical protein
MNDDFEFIKTTLRAAIDDAYRLGVGAAIETMTRYRGQTLDVETLDRVIEDLRRHSAGAERPS